MKKFNAIGILGKLKELIFPKLTIQQQNKPRMAYFINLILLFSVLANPIFARKLKIITTYPFLTDMVKNIVQDKAMVESLSSGYEDPHFVDPRPSMVAKLRSADAVVVAGMSLDMWVDSLIDAARNSSIVFGAPGYIDVSARIIKLEVPQGKVDASVGDIHPDGNPHYFTDPRNAKNIVAEIVKKLSLISPENREFFEKNQQEFNRILDEKITMWQELLKPFKGSKIITYHNSWPYFEEFSGIKIIEHIEPKPGIPPSPSHLNKLVSIIKTENVKLILSENYFSQKAPNFLKDKTGVKILSVPVDIQEDKGISSYIDLWDKNIHSIVKALE